jgi:hypothetical protein
MTRRAGTLGFAAADGPASTAYDIAASGSLGAPGPAGRHARPGSGPGRFLNQDLATIRLDR